MTEPVPIFSPHPGFVALARVDAYPDVVLLLVCQSCGVLVAEGFTEQHSATHAKGPSSA